MAQDTVVHIGVVETLSGLLADRGNQVVNIYRNNIDRVNSEGGLTIGQTRYKIDLVVKDSQSNLGMAVEKAKELILLDKVAALLCYTRACAPSAEEYRIPTLLVDYSFRLTEARRNVFLIVAPGPDGFKTQAELAMAALRRAMTTSGRPSSENIAAAFRAIDFTTSLGSIKFDEFGNNIGVVPYPFRISPNASCANSCGASCPSNCGQVACTKSGGSECCSICTRPAPP
jgi:hypothetical protein